MLVIDRRVRLLPIGLVGGPLPIADGGLVGMRGGSLYVLSIRQVQTYTGNLVQTRFGLVCLAEYWRFRSVLSERSVWVSMVVSAGCWVPVVVYRRGVPV